MLMRLLGFLVGLILLPLCAAATLTVGSLIMQLQPACATAIPPAAWAMIGGLALWLLIYSALPRPVRTYVLAHELTHALWGMLMGARILKMDVSKERGSVTLTKTNFLITLAPYFFPLYTVLVIALYWILSLFRDMEPYYLLWLGLVAFTWGFHLTFTISTLLQRQNDIRECGHLFSYTVIYLMNVLGICLWIVAVSEATAAEVGAGFYEHTVAVFSGLRGLVEALRNAA